MKNPNQIYLEAHTAGMTAAQNCTPSAMVVNYVANGEKVREVVEGGVCGFAWVKMPNRGKFVNFLKQEQIGRKNEWEGGYHIWIGDFDQSMERKSSYARAFSKVLNENGIKATPHSRMD